MAGKYPRLGNGDQAFDDILVERLSPLTSRRIVGTWPLFRFSREGILAIDYLSASIVEVPDITTQVDPGSPGRRREEFQDASARDQKKVADSRN